MSKYILKKDLPFAKAGTEVKLVNEKKAIEYNGYQCDIYDLRDGWIEEIKPREFLVFLNKEGFPIDIFLPDLAPERALDEVIKVREVL